MATDDFKVKKTEDEWREQLTPEQYYVCRQKGTERPGTGQYDQFFKPGTYHCVACIVVSRYRFWVTVNHNGFVTVFTQRK